MPRMWSTKGLVASAHRQDMARPWCNSWAARFLVCTPWWKVERRCPGYVGFLDGVGKGGRYSQ